MNRLRKYFVLSVAAEAAVGTILLVGPGQQPKAHAALNCSVQYAWDGVESSNLTNDNLLDRISIPNGIELMHVRATNSYAMKSGAVPNFTEELVLMGVSNTAITYNSSNLLPYLPNDPNFGQMQVQTTGGAAWNDQPYLQDGVIAATIAKSYETGSQMSTPVDVTMNPAVNIPAGGMLWLRMGAAGAAQDPESQFVLTYKNAGC